MMKTTIALIVIMTLVLSAGLCASGSSGVYVLRTGTDAKGSQTSVEFVDIGSKQKKIVVTPESMPPSANASISTFKASSDGKYLLLKHPGGYEITDKKTKEKRTVYGDTCWKAEGEYVSRVIPDRLWVLNAVSKKWQEIPNGDSFGSFDWSPKGNLLLLRGEKIVKVYDPQKASFILQEGVSEYAPVVWSSDGKGIIAIKTGKSKTTPEIVYTKLLNGKSGMLFGWTGGTEAITQSPNGTTFVVYDGDGFYIYDIKSKRMIKLDISRKDVGFEVVLSFNPSGNGLAVYTVYNYGEPHVFYDEKLWTVDATSGKVQEVSHWQESFQGGDPFSNKKLQGWLDDGTLVVSGNTGDWFKLWTVDMTKHDAPAREIFDSGKGCAGIAWVRR